MTSTAAPPALRRHTACAAFAFAVFAFAVVRTAWISDDAYITFRTIENWLDGYGLRWNIAERVQTYTHPLWMLLCTLTRALAGELYYATLVLSALCTAATFVLLARTARGGAATLCALVLAALSSRAFVDYSTSGLENPLSHALLAAFALAWFRDENPVRRLRTLGLLGALLACTRMDLALLVTPAILAGTRGVPRARALATLALASAPFMLWLLFATFYYGTPFPSTAYSKAFAVGIPAGDLALQGARYFADTALRDPATLPLLALGVGAAIPTRGRTALPLQLGVVLYCVYVLRVGGDFMAGRFFTSPLVFALASLAVRAADLAPRLRLAAGPLLFAFGCTAGLPPVLAGTPPLDAVVHRWGIVDERACYWHVRGLCSPGRSIPSPGTITAALRAGGVTEPVVDLNGGVGVHGYLAGPLFHVVDFWLCDPVLCRLPTFDRTNWRIGHFTRRVPEGYLELLAHGDTSRCDPHFARFVAAVHAATRGELWSWARLRAALGLIRGDAEPDRAAFVAGSYFAPPVPVVDARELDREVPAGTYWFRTNARVVYAGGLDVAFAAPQLGRTVALMLTSEHVYELEFRAGAAVLATAQVATDTALYAGMREYEIVVPAAARGFTSLRIRSDAQPLRVSAVASVRARE